LGEADLDWVLALNATLETELSPLTRQGLVALVGTALHARVVEPQAGFLIALDQDAAYASPNFRWLRERLARFVYVDRLAIARTARGQGLAAALYDDLFATARAAGWRQVACEVNLEPPNPASDAFHARLGFLEIGRAKLGNGKTVRYLSRSL
jgi:hypothetical protein